MAVPFLACMAAVAAFYQLPPRVLPSIHAVEGGRIGTVHRNTDGSEDLGWMQVNTRWLPVLSRFTGEDTTVLRTRLLQNACFNIAAAGAIMRTYLNQEQGDLMRAVGDYHSHTPALNEAYQAAVVRSALAIFGRGAAVRSASR